jgi:hypothetical protein
MSQKTIDLYVVLDTVRWSNFDHHAGPKTGGFLAKYRGDPLRKSSKMKAYPSKPPADTMFMAAMAMVLP